MGLLLLIALITDSCLITVLLSTLNIDIYGAPLQKLPNVDFSKHMGQQSDGSTSSLHSSSQEQVRLKL